MKVQITIRGRVFHIRTDDDPEQLQRIAEELNDKLNALAPVGRSVDEYAILVISALSILGESKQKEDLIQQKVVELEQRVDALLQIIDQNLQELDPTEN